MGEIIEPPPIPKNPEKIPPIEPAIRSIDLLCLFLTRVGFLKNKIIDAITKRVNPNIVLIICVSTKKDICAPIKAIIEELITKGATNCISKSFFLRFKILVVIVVTLFTKSPLARAKSKDNPAIFKDGTNPTAEPNPAIAKIVDNPIVRIKYIK